MAVKNVSDGRFTRNAPALKEMHILWITAGLSCDGDIRRADRRDPAEYRRHCDGRDFRAFPKFICINPVLVLRESRDEYIQVS
ncbi:MAG: hypothetical protein WKF71_12600 [Pyrinomonadaceae bacterium]